MTYPKWQGPCAKKDYSEYLNLPLAPKDTIVSIEWCPQADGIHVQRKRSIRHYWEPTHSSMRRVKRLSNKTHYADAGLTVYRVEQ